MRRYLCACIALVAMFGLAGCGGSKGQAGNAASKGGAGSSKSYAELRWGSLPVGGPLDWYKSPQGEVLAVESLAVQSLMQYEPDGSIKPGLASSVEQPNPTTYVYHLRSVKFSDGKPMTSADVIFSLDRAMNGKESWVKSYWTDVASITAPNSATVAVKLKKPSAFFQDIVAFSGQVTEKTSTEKMGEKEIGTPGHMLIGTGPWKIDSYTPDVSAVLSRNPYWTGPQPPTRKITINFFKDEAAIALALRSGAIDGAAIYEAPKNFASIPGTRHLSAPGVFNQTITLGTEQPPFNDVHVRRAIAYATDTQGMVHALYPGGEASQAHTIMADSIFADLGSEGEVSQMLASLPQYEFNLAKAKQELAQSAYPHGFGTSIEVEAGEEGPDAVAQIMATDLSKIGINAKVNELTAQETSAWDTGKLHFIISSWGAVYPDPENLMSLILNPAQIPGLNEAKYRNSEVDRLRAESGETLNKPKRLQLIDKLLTTVNNDVPYRQLFTIASLATISEKYVYPRFSYWTQFFSPWAMNVKLAS
jgi:peptide/nickel transport system substrate-binding protein